MALNWRWPVSVVHFALSKPIKGILFCGLFFTHWLDTLKDCTALINYSTSNVLSGEHFSAKNSKSGNVSGSSFTSYKSSSACAKNHWFVWDFFLISFFWNSPRLLWLCNNVATQLNQGQAENSLLPIFVLHSDQFSIFTAWWSTSSIGSVCVID